MRLPGMYSESAEMGVRPLASIAACSWPKLLKAPRTTGPARARPRCGRASGHPGRGRQAAPRSRPRTARPPPDPQRRGGTGSPASLDRPCRGGTRALGGASGASSPRASSSCHSRLRRRPARHDDSTWHREGRSGGTATARRHAAAVAAPSRAGSGSRSPAGAPPRDGPPPTGRRAPGRWSRLGGADLRPVPLPLRAAPRTRPAASLARERYGALVWGVNAARRSFRGPLRRRTTRTRGRRRGPVREGAAGRCGAIGHGADGAKRHSSAD